MEPLAWYVEGGVELPRAEFRVDVDLVVGTVPLDSLDESVVRKLALERRRSSLKKGITRTKGRSLDYVPVMNSISNVEKPF